MACVFHNSPAIRQNIPHLECPVISKSVFVMCYEMRFPPSKQLKNRDLSYKMDLVFWDGIRDTIFGIVTLVL